MISLLGLAIYKPGLTAPFYFDDNYVIVDNVLIKSFQNIHWLWFHDPSRFLTHLSFAVDYLFYGLDPFGYHRLNLIIHFVNAGLLYGLLKLLLIDSKKILNWPRERLYTAVIFTVGIFLCHPLQTQAVTYVAQRSTLLASAAYLATLLLYLRYRITGRISFYFWALLVNAAGLFTKPIIITLPAAIILCEIYFLGFDWRKKRRSLALVPFIGLAAVVPFLLMFWRYKQLSLERIMDISQETLKISRLEYLLTQLSVFLTYLRLLVLPVNQTLDYDYPIVRNFFNPFSILGLAALVALVVVAVRLFSRHRLLSFAIFWFLLTLSLESSVFPIADVINEHRLYLPIAGFAILLAFGLNILIAKQETCRIAMVGLIAVFSILTFNRNCLWNDPAAFLTGMVDRAPKKARVQNNLGEFYFRRGNMVLAEERFRKALEIDPALPYASNNLGNALMARGQLKEAEDFLKKAVDLKADYAEPYYNLGNIRWIEGSQEEARQFYEKSAQLKPFLAKPLIGLGNYYAAKENNDLAKIYYGRALYLNPSPLAFYSLGNVYLKESKFMAAVDQYWKAIRLQPEFIDAYNNIGNVYAFHGLYDQAIAQYQKTIEIDPRYGNGYYNLGNAFYKKGKPVQAKRMYLYALKLYTEQNNAAMAEQTRKKLAPIGTRSSSEPRKQTKR